MSDDLIEDLRAIGETEMYDAPATTHATIARGVARIEAQAAEIERLREAVKDAEALICADVRDGQIVRQVLNTLRAALTPAQSPSQKQSPTR